LAERPALGDLCYSASVFRAHHDHRLAVIGTTPEQMRHQLASFRNGTSPAPAAATGQGKAKRLVFVYTGMGPQGGGMGRELLSAEPIFREALVRVDSLLYQHAGWSILSELTADESHSRITEALFAQTGNFAIQVALTELWKSWGVEPDAVVGHSVG